MEIVCAHCGKRSDKSAGAINRARKINAPLYCGRACAGLARRSRKSDAQKKQEKRLYDAYRRIMLTDQIKAAKREYHKRTYDPIKAATERQKKMPSHVEYCRRPEYKAWKKEYDRRYRANRHYGEYGDCFLIMQDIWAEVDNRMTDYDVRLANGTLNKRLQRKRDYEKAHRN